MLSQHLCKLLHKYFTQILICWREIFYVFLYMGEWELQMLMLKKVNTREGFQVLSLPQKPIRSTYSVPILQVGKLKWGMFCLHWGSVSEQPLEVDAQLGECDTPPLHKGEKRERGRHHQWWGFQEPTVPSVSIKQQLTPGKAGKLVPASSEPTAMSSCSDPSHNLVLGYGIIAPWNFINYILGSP